jgi:hypothetical protein
MGVANQAGAAAGIASYYVPLLFGLASPFVARWLLPVVRSVRGIEKLIARQNALIEALAHQANIPLPKEPTDDDSPTPA